MPRRQETWICEVCKRDACKGGCYYSPGRVRALLANMPNSTQTVTNPRNYGLSRASRDGNPMEGSWAIRADLLRALAHVAASRPNGGTMRLVVWLAYVGRPSQARQGRHVGLSDSEIGRMFDMDPKTVARYRQQGIRLMVECLNPDYQFQEGE